MASSCVKIQAHNFLIFFCWWRISTLLEIPFKIAAIFVTTFPVKNCIEGGNLLGSAALLYFLFTWGKFACYWGAKYYVVRFCLGCIHGCCWGKAQWWFSLWSWFHHNYIQEVLWHDHLFVLLFSFSWHSNQLRTHILNNDRTFLSLMDSATEDWGIFVVVCILIY